MKKLVILLICFSWLYSFGLTPKSLLGFIDTKDGGIIFELINNPLDNKIEKKVIKNVKGIVPIFEIHIGKNSKWYRISREKNWWINENKKFVFIPIDKITNYKKK